MHMYSLQVYASVPVCSCFQNIMFWCTHGQSYEQGVMHGTQSPWKMAMVFVFLLTEALHVVA